MFVGVEGSNQVQRERLMIWNRLKKTKWSKSQGMGLRVLVENFPNEKGDR